MKTDKIIKKIVSTFKDLESKATEINSAGGKNIIHPMMQRDKRGKFDSLGFYNSITKKHAVVFIRDYIARTVDVIPELDEMRNVVTHTKKK
jgi:hypothetical protein|tara:strand:- start:2433 stop:2705 length:273 start_codon:yes stop_codon:yes gene_type:complete